MGNEEQRGVRLWFLSLSLAPEPLARAQALLSPDEAARAAEFHFETGRARAIAGRGQVRAIGRSARHWTAAAGRSLSAHASSARSQKVSAPSR